MTNQQAPTESIHEGWTVATYAIHNEALRSAEARHYEERDRRYEERFKAQELAMAAALAALRSATTDAFLASEKAIEKAETAQKLYDLGHNDLLRKMDDQYGTMLPRTEAITRFERIESDIRALRDAQNAGAGAAANAAKGQSTVIAIIGALVGIAGVVLAFLSRGM